MIKTKEQVLKKCNSILEFIDNDKKEFILELTFMSNSIKTNKYKNNFLIEFDIKDYGLYRFEVKTNETSEEKINEEIANKINDELYDLDVNNFRFTNLNKGDK